MRTKFAFIIPLRNPNTAKNWELCVDICKSTIRSACNQTALITDYEVVLVCKDFPELNEFPNLRIIRENYPDPELNWEDQHRDKYSKFRTGLEYLSKHETLYVMKLDADDLVSNKIVSFVLSDNNKNGYFVDSGYSYHGGNSITPLEKFHKVCGSSNILYSTGYSLLKENVLNSNLIKLGHHITVQEYEKNRHPLSVIPFRAVIYRKDHGENITSHYIQSGITHNKPNLNYYIGKTLKNLINNNIRIDNKIRHEFSL